jgi:hypothetical protein
LNRQGQTAGAEHFEGMVNEGLCKILCHNLACLIQEPETLGITPGLWKDEGPEPIN